MAPSTPISVRQAQAQPDLIVAALQLPGAIVELCAFPPLQAETVQAVEEQSILSLGLSKLLDEAEGRFSATPRFSRFGSLNFRPAGVPFEARVSQGQFHTIRCRFEEAYLQRLGIYSSALSTAQLETCFDIHAPAIEDNMMRLAEELSHPGADAPTLAEALVSVVTIDLARYIADAGRRELQNKGGLAPRHLRQVLSCMSQPGPAPSIDQLAGLCGLSRYHFMRAFRESTGESAGSYARRLLMARARNMLAADDRSIADIAQALGFRSVPAFSSAFRGSCGRSPRAWRACLR